MKRMLAVFTLLACLTFSVHADDKIIIGGNITQEQVDEARKQIESGQQTLKMMAQNVVTLKPGEFQVVERKDTIKGELYWQWTNWDVQTVGATSPYITRHDVKAGQEVWIHKIRAGDTEAKDHFFPAQPAPWSWVSANKEGVATLTVMANGDAGKTPVPVSVVKFVVGQPKPIEPVNPPVNPPGPVTPVTPVTGLRVVLVYESEDAMTREQLAILASPKIKDWLNAHCAKDEKGRPGWRKWDKDVDTKLETSTWQSLWTAIKPKLGPLPQIVIVSNQKGETFELPDTEQKTLDLLANYGGK